MASRCCGAAQNMVCRASLSLQSVSDVMILPDVDGICVSLAVRGVVAHGLHPVLLAASYHDAGVVTLKLGGLHRQEPILPSLCTILRTELGGETSLGRDSSQCTA